MFNHTIFRNGNVLINEKRSLRQHETNILVGENCKKWIRLPGKGGISPIFWEKIPYVTCHSEESRLEG